MLLLMSDGRTWLTYKQAAERLGLPTPEAAEAEAERANWPKRVRDDTGEGEIAALARPPVARSEPCMHWMK